MIITHEKGAHAGKPNGTRPIVREIVGSAAFLDDSRYFLIPHSEQADWNKLTGIAFNPLKPNDNAILIAWRYNVDKDVFEVCPYFNDDGKIHNPETGGFVNPNHILTFRKNEAFSFRINYDGVRITRVNYPTGQTTTIFQPKPSGLKTRFITSFRINSWFGGTLPAPTDVRFVLDI